MSYVNIATLNTTASTTTVTITSTESLVGFQSGDTLFVAGHEFPLIIDSVSGFTVTLLTPASTTLTAAPALAIKSNVKLRDALAVIEENNLRWSQNFGAFINWMTTSASTADMYDALGNTVTVTSVQGVNDLVADASTAASDLTIIEGRITVAESDLTTIEGTLDAKVAAAEAAKIGAETSLANIGLSETNAENAATASAASESNAAVSATNAADSATQAQASVDSLSLVNSTMNFLSFSIDSTGDLIATYNGIQEASAFSINSNGELEVTI